MTEPTATTLRERATHHRDAASTGAVPADARAHNETADLLEAAAQRFQAPVDVEEIRFALTAHLAAVGFDFPNAGYDEPNVITVENGTTEFRLTISEI